MRRAGSPPRSLLLGRSPRLPRISTLGLSCHQTPPLFCCPGQAAQLFRVGSRSPGHRWPSGACALPGGVLGWGGMSTLQFPVHIVSTCELGRSPRPANAPILQSEPTPSSWCEKVLLPFPPSQSPPPATPWSRRPSGGHSPRQIRLSRAHGTWNTTLKRRVERAVGLQRNKRRCVLQPVGPAGPSLGEGSGGPQPWAVMI